MFYLEGNLLLQKVETSEYEYPNQIHEMPVKTYFFNHFIMTSFFVFTINCIYQNKDVEDNTTGNVGTMETGNGKEEVEEITCRLR